MGAFRKRNLLSDGVCKTSVLILCLHVKSLSENGTKKKKAERRGRENRRGGEGRRRGEERGKLRNESCCSPGLLSYPSQETVPFA